MMQVMSDAESRSPTRPPLTDSPWFWVMLFCAAGVVLLLVIWPQYSKRQRRLEMQFRAREEIVRRQAAGEPPARVLGREGSAAPPAEGELIIRLWPLLLLFSALFAVSTTMLVRARRSAAQFADNPIRAERP